MKPLILSMNIYDTPIYKNNSNLHKKNDKNNKSEKNKPAK